MKLDFKNERVLAVVAHPDDAELLCAGTLARARKEGAKIGIAVLCQGDKGQPAKPIKNLAAVRRQEIAAAARLLGAELFSEKFLDGTLSDDYRSRLRVLELIRQFQPTLILTHAPEDYHPDHQSTSKLVEAGSWLCSSRGHKTKSPALASPPPLWWMDTVNTQGFTPQFYVDISGFESIKEEMLACHTSQLLRGDDKDFSPLAELMRLQFQARGSQCGVAAAEAFRAHHAFKRTRAW